MINKRYISALAGIFVLSVFAAASYAQERASDDVKDQVARVQNAIKEKGANWTAGETAVASLPREDWRYLVGLNFEPVGAPPAPLVAAAGLPVSLDWRDLNGNFVTAPRNQKKCGSCWAFAMTGGLESYILRTQNKPGTDIDLSEQVLVSCSGTGSCGGGRLSAAFLKKTGLPLESAYPYTATNGDCSAAAPGWQGSAYKIGNWGSVPQDLESIKAALVNYGPLPIAMMVYEDFMYYKTGVYSYTTGKKLGGHAVLLVGYDDAGQYFIVKNSWDSGWGEKGFFRIAYSQLENEVSFGLSAIAYYDSKADGFPASGFNPEAASMRTAPIFETAAGWTR